MIKRNVNIPNDVVDEVKTAITEKSQAARKLPIVFCIDASPSMSRKGKDNKTSMQILNECIKEFINDLNKSISTRNVAEIAFLTFSTDIVELTEFKSARNWAKDIPSFNTVKEGGTNIPLAIDEAYKMVHSRKKENLVMGVQTNSPFFVFFTDGDVDRKNSEFTPEVKEAISTVTKYCTSHIGGSDIVVPFIVGIGEDVNKKMLKALSSGFVNGFFHISSIEEAKERSFKEVFKVISNSAIGTINLNNTESVIKKIKKDVQHIIDIAYKDTIDM